MSEPLLALTVELPLYAAVTVCEVPAMNVTVSGALPNVLSAMICGAPPSTTYVTVPVAMPVLGSTSLTVAFSLTLPGVVVAVAVIVVVELDFVTVTRVVSDVLVANAALPP